MFAFKTKRRLKTETAIKIMAFAGFLGFQGEAHAGSVCTANTLLTPRTFHCIDAVTTIADGTYSAGGTFSANSNGGFAVSSSSALAVTMSGQVNSSTLLPTGWSSAVDLSTTNSLSFVNSGTINASSGSTIYGAYLRGAQITNAQTGTVIANGGYSTTGVFAASSAGSVSVTGGSTTVSGLWSRGLWVDAFGGNNVTNTGSVSAAGQNSRGVIARALSNSNGCTPGDNPSVTVNTTGNVSADFIAITTLSCGASNIIVGAGTTVSTSGVEGQTIRSIGTTASTTINGSVLAASTSDRALDVRSSGSTTTIGATGLLSGTFAGDEGADQFTVQTGGTWTSAGASEFRGGSDTLLNQGSINLSSASFADLESLQNAGTMNLTGSLTLNDSSLFENTGTINVASGVTTINSLAPVYNNGSLNMVNGHSGDILNITNDYVAGPNATLSIETDGKVSDTLVVSGSTTGSTVVLVTGPVGLMASRILIAKGDSPTGNLAIGTASAGSLSFSIGNQASQLIDFQLQAAGGNIYIMTALNDRAFDPLAIGMVSNDMAEQSAKVVIGNAFNHRSGDKKVALWGQLYLGTLRTGEDTTVSAFGDPYDVDGRLETTQQGIQLGLDIGVGNTARVGLTGGYERADANFRNGSNGLDARAFNLGLYAALTPENGFHGGFLAKMDQGHVKWTGQAFASMDSKPEIRAWSGQLDLGYRFPAGSVVLDPRAHIAYSVSKIEDFGAEGISYALKDVKGWTGSIGLRADFKSRSFSPFLSADVWRDSGYDRGVRLESETMADSFKVDGSRTWVRLEAGLDSAGKSGPSFATWANIGDQRGIGARLGWRF